MTLNRIDTGILQAGLSYPDYRSSISRNIEVFDEVYEHPAFTPEDLTLLRQMPPMTVLAIGEDWCPDVYQTLPTWVRVAESVPGWNLRIFPRDEHPDLMHAFLSDSRKRIPVYAFYDASLQLQVWWSGRGREAQDALDTILQGRSFDSLDEEAHKHARDVFNIGYPRQFRRQNFKEILALLCAFFHLR